MRHKPKLFTEHGILYGELSNRLTELEKTVKTQGRSIDFILDLVGRELKKKRIGFKPDKEK